MTASDFPPWLTGLSTASLWLAGISFLIVAIDLLRHPQKMWIMNLVWPLTALYAGPLAVLLYWRTGRATISGDKPFWQSVAVGATHCGSGCTLGDMVAECIVAFAPLVIFGQKIFGGWLIDFVCAYLFGVVFQYFSIKPMRNLSPAAGIWAAIKADTLSLTAWQVGMYGWMAIATFLIFGHELNKSSSVFWFMMQIAMLFGFCTAYPVNWWLIRKGIKETM